MTDPAALTQAAETLRALHGSERPLVLPNAWDAASAKTFAKMGFPALATTSGGIAEAHGYRDGEQIPAAQMLAAVRRIATAVDIPVTADLEGGYGLEPAELVEQLIGAGACGMNFEDTDHAHAGGELVDLELQAARIAALKEAGHRAGLDLVLNARIDVYLHGDADADARLAEAVRRGRAYRAAGADCVFPIGVRDAGTVATLARELGAPFNVLVLPGLPSISELARLGATRVSFGSGLMRLALSGLERRAERLRGDADEPVYG